MPFDYESKLSKHEIDIVLEAVEKEIHELETPYPDEATKGRLHELWEIKLTLIEQRDRL